MAVFFHLAMSISERLQPSHSNRQSQIRLITCDAAQLGSRCLRTPSTQWRTDSGDLQMLTGRTELHGFSHNGIIARHVQQVTTRRKEDSENLLISMYSFSIAKERLLKAVNMYYAIFMPTQASSPKNSFYNVYLYFSKVSKCVQT